MCIRDSDFRVDHVASSAEGAIYPGQIAMILRGFLAVSDAGIDMVEQRAVREAKSEAGVKKVTLAF
eukprot:3522134-Rhodomonas_salina.2